MKRKWHITINILFIVLTGLLFIHPGPAMSVCPAPSVTDYTAYPPFIVANIKPNLLLMIDNSGSMFDLEYIDKGVYTGTCTGGSIACSNMVICPTGQTCANITYTRKPFYCYDQTYNDGNTYAGYFKNGDYYEYSTDYFNETTQAAFAALSCTKNIPGILCIIGTNLPPSTATPKSIDRFVAKGNYLNWLTASKFDVEKQILTGGKYDTTNNNLDLETRGCVGRRFIKEPITTQSFQNYTCSTLPCSNPNTGLGLTFAVKGPDHPYSETLLSPGGQTYLEIYAGDYIEANCQKAVTDIINQENKNTVTGDIELCLNYDAHGQYCSLDMFTSCDDDADCEGTTGTCSGLVSGTCGLGSGGVCGVTTTGTCTSNNGTCPSGKKCIGGSAAGAACNNIGDCPGASACSRACSGGGKAGSACNNDGDCLFKSCTVGSVGNPCSVNTDCNLKTCTNSGSTHGMSCVVNTECDIRTCSVGQPATTPCTMNSDCNLSGTCAHDPSIVCLNDTNCSSGYKGVCQKPVTQQIKSTFGQSMHECYDYWNNGFLSGNNWWTMMTNPSGCNQMYKELLICNGGSRDGKTCVVSADCTGGGTCINGPTAIRQGSPVLVCGIGYVGYCAGSTDNWATTNWYAREYASAEDCVKAKFEAFCGAAQVPPVTDPTDDPSSTENFDNLPAIIGDMGIGAQLGDPIKKLTVNLHTATAPTGLLQDFEKLIRFGAMTFNDFGSATECPANVSCSKICEVGSTSCMVDADCSSGSCVLDTANSDGGHIIPGGYIQGRCSITTATTCSFDADCHSGETCVYSVGSHSSGLVNSIDSVFASTWTPFSEGFYNAIGYYAQRTDKRLNAGDFITQAENSAYKDPSQYTCQKNNVLLVTDGMSTTDLNPSVISLATTYNDGDGRITTTASTCPKYAGSVNIDDLAWLAKHRNIKNFSETPLVTDEAINQKTIDTYVVFNGEPSNDAGECNPDTLMSETAKNGCGTTPGCYQRAEYPDQLRQALYNAFLAIAGATSSGTAVSVLATTGEGEGAVYQAYFYPMRRTGSYEAKWTGYLQSLFVDGYGNLREDTNLNDQLDLHNDNVIKMWYDLNAKTTYVDRFVDNKLNSDGTCNATQADGKLNCIDADNSGRLDSPCTDHCDVYLDTKPFDNLLPIWEAGRLLFSRAQTDRKIFTTLNGYSFTDSLAADSTKGTFYDANQGALRPYLRAGTNAESADIINYVRGTDIAGYRTRTLTIDAATNTWKLGDIVYSSPQVSGKPAETFNFRYNDTSYDAYKTAYNNRRNIVFVGANDGMLHAFNAGTYDKIIHKFGDTTYALGRELWAFVPKGILPQLKWLVDPNYAHSYYVDLKPRISDVKIFTPDATHVNGWGTIVIGGMRFGGKDMCVTDNFGSGIEDKTFRSEYFAIDITDPLNPSLLWTFSDAGLGLTASFPAIVRVKTDPALSNSADPGNWYAVFGSGPTEYDGSSVNPGAVYVIDLNSGTNGVINSWTADTNYKKFLTGDSNAFMSDGVAVDVNTDYAYDVAYLGETYYDAGWKGKMFRLATKNTTMDSWELSTLYNAGKPVTASPSVAKDSKGNVFVYFGTGRFIATSDKTSTDQQAFYGIKDVCKPWLDPTADSTHNWDCTTTVQFADLLDSSNAVVTAEGNTITNVTGVTNWSELLGAINTKDGWYLNFPHSGERNYVKPLILGGLVAWATYIPSTNPCRPEGDSYVYAVYYETGTAYKKYVFVEEKYAATPPSDVGRSKYLGKGAPSNLVGMLTKSGTAKGFAQSQGGNIAEIEFDTALKTHGFRGWKGGRIE